MDFISQDQQLLQKKDEQISQEFEKSTKISREYNKVSFETKMQIVNLMQNEKLSFKEVSRQLKVKLCTCKQIIKKYQLEGNLKRKNKRRGKIDISVQFKLQIVHPLSLNQHENLASKRIHMFVEQKELNSAELQSLMDIIREKIIEYINNLEGLSQTNIIKQKMKMPQNLLHPQIVENNIEWSLSQIKGKIYQLPITLKNKYKKEDHVDRSIQTNSQILKNFIEIQKILDFSLNKSIYDQQYVKQQQILTQECITLLKKQAIFNNNFTQINMMAKRISNMLRNSICCSQPK